MGESLGGLLFLFFLLIIALVLFGSIFNILFSLRGFLGMILGWFFCNWFGEDDDFS